MNERMNERMNVRTNEHTNEQKSENYIPPHTSYVGGIIRKYGDNITECHLSVISQQTTTATNRVSVMHAVIHAWYMSGLISRSVYIAIADSGPPRTAIYWSYTVLHKSMLWYSLMSTNNICFCGEIRKIFHWCHLLSGAMGRWHNMIFKIIFQELLLLFFFFFCYFCTKTYLPVLTGIAFRRKFQWCHSSG